MQLNIKNLNIFNEDELDKFLQFNEIHYFNDECNKNIVITLVILEHVPHSFLIKAFQFTHPCVVMKIKLIDWLESEVMVGLVCEFVDHYNKQPSLELKNHLKFNTPAYHKSWIKCNLPHIFVDLACSTHKHCWSIVKPFLLFVFPNARIILGPFLRENIPLQLFHKDYGNKFESNPKLCAYLTDFQTFYSLHITESWRERFEDLKIGEWITPAITLDSRENVDGIITSFQKSQIPKHLLRMDHEERKIHSLSVHSKLSDFDGCFEWKELAAIAKEWGHMSLGIADFSNVQHFPEVEKAAKEIGIKPLYGFEVEMSAEINIVMNEQHCKSRVFCFFDIETTGLYPLFDDLIEIAISKQKDGYEIDRYHTFVKTNKKLNKYIVELTNITQQQVSEGKEIKVVLQEIKDFIGNSNLVAHNGIGFDYPFLQSLFKREGMTSINNPIIDTLQFAKAIFGSFKSFSLSAIAKKLSIAYDEDEMHSATGDIKPLIELFAILKNSIKSLNIEKAKDLSKLNSTLINKQLKIKQFGKRALIYAKNQQGIKDLYELVSLANTEWFLGKPNLNWKVLKEKRKNISVVSTLTHSLLLELVLSNDFDSFQQEIEHYDFILIPPPSAFNHHIHRNDFSMEDAEFIVRTYYEWTIKTNKKPIANSCVKYAHPWHKQQYAVLVHSKSVGGRRHYLYSKNKDNSSLPDYSFKTTEQLKEEFNFLSLPPKEKESFLFENNEQFVKQIKDDLEIIKKTLHPPYDNSLSEKIKKESISQMKIIYGEKIDPFLENRMNRELHEIFSHKYDVIFWISHLLVQESLKDGYLVGSRGSVGSSFVAFLLRISNVNPLPPHYFCKPCSIFENREDAFDSGFDLVDKNCENCGLLMQTDGQYIPFETFAGLNGNKVPDIDLNFSGEYQSKAHKFLKNFFGAENTFRAGTVSTIANKTAFALTMNYLELMKEKANSSKKKWLTNQIINVKRTTGQHPGGILVLPNTHSINDFTPVNYPADDVESEWLTTHFEFSYLHDALLKFDILGHDDPTILKLLQHWTGKDPKDVPNKDERVLSIFSNSIELKAKGPFVDETKPGTIGLPEFGTNSTIKILKQCQPKTFGDLIRISGVSHGTDVWKKNIDDLIKKHKFCLRDVITCRDDVMNYLLRLGGSQEMAFHVMESVRKGKGVPPKYLPELKKIKVPEWYIKSANKISYIFPKAHATAYVLMAWKIAYYKVFYPLEFYASYFTIQAQNFDVESMLQNDPNSLVIKMKEFSKKAKTYSLTSKEKGCIPLYQVAVEFFSCGFVFKQLQLNESRAHLFVPENNSLLIPWIVLDGMGANTAEAIEKTVASEGAFIDREDFEKRIKLNKTLTKKLINWGILAEQYSSKQLNIDDILN